MRTAALLAFLTILAFAGCRTKPESPKVPRARHDLYKPLPTPGAPKPVPGLPTPKRALPD